MYVGLKTPTLRLEDEKAKEKKKGEKESGEKREERNKIRKIEDGLLLVVAARIYGKQIPCING